MKVTLVSHFRDGSTGLIRVINEDGSEVEYWVHSMNWGNNRTDVTKRLYVRDAEEYTVNRDELIQLVNAFREYVSNSFKSFDTIDKYKLAEYYHMMESFMITCGILVKRLRDA